MVDEQAFRHVPDPRPGPDVTVGVVTAPSVSHELTPDVIDDMSSGLTARFLDVTWRIEVIHDGLVEPRLTTVRSSVRPGRRC